MAMTRATGRGPRLGDADGLPTDTRRAVRVAATTWVGNGTGFAADGAGGATCELGAGDLGTATSTTGGAAGVAPET